MGIGAINRGGVGSFEKRIGDAYNKTGDAKMKHKSKKEAKGRAWRAFSRFIRLRDCLRTTGSPDWGECFSCDNPPQHTFRRLQAGHFIPKHNANLFSERGTQAQCSRCNQHLSGNQLEYRRQLNKLYGEGAADEIEQEAHQYRKDYTIEELDEINEYYKEKIKELNNG